MQPLKVVNLRDFPVADKPPEEIKRPYRLWNTREKAQVKWAFFLNLRHAHMRALCEAAWSNTDAVFEVFDIRIGALRGQYRRVGQNIQFWRSNHHLEDN